MPQNFIKQTIFTSLLTLGLIFSPVNSGKLVAPVQAQTEPVTEVVESVTEAEEDATTGNTIQDKLREILKKQATKVESVFGELTNKRRGFIGQVVRVSEETLTLEIRGTTRIVALDEGVTLMRANATIKPENIEIGSWAMVMGLVTNESFAPKKISFFATSLRPDTQIVYLGSLKAIKSTSLDFQARGQENMLTVALTRNTLFQNNAGEEVELNDFVEDDQVLLVGRQVEDKITVTVLRALAPFNRN